MKRPILPLPLVLTLAAGLPALAQNTPSTRLSLKGLRGIGLRVEPINRQAEADGLSTRAIHAAVRQRLSKAGIPLLTPERTHRTRQRPCLGVSVATAKLETGEHIYSIRVEVNQWVASLGNPRVTVTAAVPIPARTWSPAGVFGITPADQLSRRVLAAVSGMVDEFIDAYHKANPGETAAGVQRGGRPG